MKKCSKCKEVQNLEEFSRDRSNKDGFQCQCKSCLKAYYEANKDKIKARKKAYDEANKDRKKAYNKANKDKIKAYKKAYYEANKDKIKAYREANKNKRKAYHKAYNKANKDKLKAYREANKDKIKAYREANKDKLKAYHKAYHKANEDKKKAYHKVYREAKKSERIERLKQIIEPNKDNQWVYIMQCGIYHKIGISNDPLKRCKEIERETKAPTDIIYLAKAFSGRTKDCENIIHYELGCFNVPMPYAGSDTTSREWFYGSLDKMVEVVSLYADVEKI